MDKSDTTKSATAKDKQQSPNITRKIGGMTYKVSIHFSKTSKENMNDKILRLVRHDVEKTTE